MVGAYAIIGKVVCDYIFGSVNDDVAACVSRGMYFPFACLGHFCHPDKGQNMLQNNIFVFCLFQ